MIFGSVLGLCLTPPWKVYRSDGSPAGHNQNLNDYGNETVGQKFARIVKREVLSIAAIRHEKRVFFLIPMFFAANWFYSYQQNIVNGSSFDLDGRALNSALYWMAQMLGAFIMGYICDMPWFSRPKRALIAWAFLFVFGNIVMGGGLAFELVREGHAKNWIQFKTSEYAGGAILYFFYGMFDSLWQSVGLLKPAGSGSVLICSAYLLAPWRYVLDSRARWPSRRYLQGRSVGRRYYRLPAYRAQRVGQEPVHLQLGRHCRLPALCP